MAFAAAGFCRGWLGDRGEEGSHGSVPNAVSPAPETGPRMPMRDVTEHEMDTERARRGLSSTLHADIETSCGVRGLHVSGSERVSFEARNVQRLRNEAAAGGLVVQVVLADLEKASKWIKLTERKCLEQRDSAD